MNSGTGKILAGCGCLTWLGCVLIVVVMTVLPMAGIYLPAAAGFGTYAASCCATFSFFVALIGIILALVGKKPNADDV
jgi:hypothetical protein